MKKIEITDTTLRDGEQTWSVSFSDSEKLSIASLLIEDLNIDHIEVASARVSEKEFEAVKKISEWAKKNAYLDKIEVLGFVDKGVSLEWIKDAGAKIINLLSKGSLKHCLGQLKVSPEKHIEDVKRELEQAEKMGLSVNLYLEDWSNGMLNSPDYVFNMIENLKDYPIGRFVLPDTLGILNPENTYEYCKQMVDTFPDLYFDFHAHNDYDLVIGNVFSSVKAGMPGIHVTVNGLGERAGNAPLSSVVTLLHDQLKIKTKVVEKNLNMVSRIVESYSGIRIPNNKPVIGDSVFTQCAGVHADGDNKNNLYCNDLIPERFGRSRVYALGKTSGKANIKKNLESLGIELDEKSMKKVTDEIVRLGDQKEIITQGDLPYIIADVLHNQNNNKIKIVNYSLSVSKGLRPTATVRLDIAGKEYEETAPGDGQYHAFSKALWKIYTKLGKLKPTLTDYSVTVTSGGRTDALVQTVISWNFKGKDFKTRGLDIDQTVASIKATIKMLNLIENM